MPLSTTERLERCQAAIARAEKLQSYGMGGRNVTHASLKELYAQEKYLIDLLAQENGTKPKLVGINFNGIA